MKKQMDAYKPAIHKNWVIEKLFYKRVMLIWTYPPARIINLKSIL